MTTIQNFATLPFIDALKAFFKTLNVPVDYIADAPTTAEDILDDKFNENNEAHKLINEVYALGMVNDAIFKDKENTTFESLEAVKEISADYEGLLIFGITLKTPPNWGGLGRGCQLVVNWPKLLVFSIGFFLIRPLRLSSNTVPIFRLPTLSV